MENQHLGNVDVCSLENNFSIHQNDSDMNDKRLEKMYQTHLKVAEFCQSN
jgi:hypothetical protein